ncbi:MAG: ComEC/Rec2 family competence protein [Desulfosporosinus sp.]|nr:ComEC/Rec2 family competence protein [Desulfosporosinus sp.]
MKIAGIFLALLLILSGCSSNAAPATSSTKVDESKQAQASEQQAAATIKDVASTTVVPGQKLRISYIDVGQGDSILIQIPNGKNVLIDAGNNGDANTITSYLKKQSVSKLDIVIATHPHEDHIGSMNTVINTFDIGQVIMPKKDSTTQTYKALITAIQNKGLKITEAKAGLKLDLGPEVNALLIAPNSVSYEDVNNYSAVLKLSYGTNTFLFEGDAQEQSENEMINAGFNLKADVLKVGHHGSNTSSSSAFLAKVQPKFAVISVGKGNSYGHPAKVTIDHLTNIGAKVFRTDISGTIVAESDGTNITINAIATEVQPRAPTPAVSAAPAPVAAVVTAPAPTPVTSAVVTPSPAPKQTNQDVTVFITKTGKKYHIDGCRSLSKSKIPISLSEAQSKGYTPCSICNPPQ